MSHSPPRVPSTDEIGSALLRAGREHAPTRESRHRALVGLGLAASAATVALTGSTSAAASTPAKAVLWLSAVKWVGLAAVVVSAASATLIFNERTAGSTKAQGSASAALRTPLVPVGSRSVNDAPVSDGHLSSAAEAEPTKNHAEAPAAQSSKPADAVGARSYPDDLGQELTLLQHARSALQSGDKATADSALRAYARRFPAGRLRPEAMVLRVDLLVQQGERDQARALARRFAKAYPDSPHALRLRTIE